MGRSYSPVRIFPFGPFVCNLCMDFFFIFLYCGSNKVIKLAKLRSSKQEVISLFLGC
jgi:hypothetical protein